MPGATQLPEGPIPFGNYLLDGLLAEGGMARVYRARLRGLGGFEKVLVVKQILPALALDPRFISMFVEEAKTLVQLSHPHVVPVYELGVVDGVYFLAMEHVEGATLSAVVDGGPLPPPLAAHVGAQVADALHYAHSRFGLVHRDVTPRNVLVDSAGHVRLLDFGIAAPAEDASVDHPIFGSPGYMAPEQMRGEGCTPATDLFALGAVLHYVLTGTHAFVRGDHAAIRRAVLEERPPTLPEGAAPEALAALVRACLARDPAARPPSAGELSGRLRAFVARSRPEGVAAELGALAQAALKSRPRAPSEPLAPPRSGREPSGLVRTLATSATLDRLLQSAGDPSPSAPPLERTVPLPPTGALPEVARSRRPSRRAMIRGLALAATGALGAGGAFFLRPMPADRAADRAPPAGHVPPSPHELANAPALATVAPDALDPVPEPSEAPRVAAEAPAKASRARAAPAGALTVNAIPWAAVRVDGRAIGHTPRRSMSIPSGAHQLTLECPPLGRSAQVPIRVGPGASVRVLADLSVDPPRIVVR